jgi:hypothetical protein
MKKMYFYILMLVAALIVTGCSNNGSESNDPKINEDNMVKSEEVTEGQTDEGEKSTLEENGQNEISMMDFFLPDGSKAHYKGEGNEYAELNIQVTHPYENYVIVHEDNGGASVRHIYKIDPDKISILEQTELDYEKAIPTLDELKAMEPIGIYLQNPLAEGATFGEWTVTQTEATVETAYKTFENAFVIERKGEDFVIRKYFVQGFGEIKQEFLMESEGNEFVVTSTIESIEK